MSRLIALTVGVYTYLTGSFDPGATAGFIVFAAGVLVGLASVVAVDRVVRRRIERDYRRWVASGKPERRARERREADAR